MDWHWDKAHEVVVDPNESLAFGKDYSIAAKIGRERALPDNKCMRPGPKMSRAEMYGSWKHGKLRYRGSIGTLTTRAICSWITPAQMAG